jgi:hypothetical protein
LGGLRGLGGETGYAGEKRSDGFVVFHRGGGFCGMCVSGARRNSDDAESLRRRR